MKFNIQAKLFLGFIILLIAVMVLQSTATSITVRENVYKIIPPGTTTISYYEGETAEESKLTIRSTSGPPAEVNPEQVLSELNTSFFGIIFGTLIVSILLSFILSRMFVKPIRSIAGVTRAIAAGDYSKRVNLKTRDEIQELANSVNNMAENLEKTEMLRRELVSNVSHELATPLTNIQGYVEALRDGVVAGEDREKETLGIIAEEAARLEHIIDDLRELSRIESSAFTLSRESIHLDEAIERVVVSVQPQVDEKRISLRTGIPPDLPEVNADRDRITQILVNLLGNAVRFTPKGGWIEVNAVHEHNYVKVSVRDNGCGIPAQDLPHIFERFYRVDRSRSRGTGGTGIGLAIVRQLVHAHGGTIAVASEEGVGTTFSFTLPL